MNWLSLLGLEAFMARWRANVIEGAIAAEDRLELAGAVDCCNRAYCSDPGAGVDGHTGAVLGHATPRDGRLGGRWRMAGGLVRSHHQTRFGGAQHRQWLCPHSARIVARLA